MKSVLIIAIAIVVAACATGADHSHSSERCLVQDFGSRKFKIVKVDGLDIHAVDLKTGEGRVISKLAHGWSEVPCR